MMAMRVFDFYMFVIIYDLMMISNFEHYGFLL